MTAPPITGIPVTTEAYEDNDPNGNDASIGMPRLTPNTIPPAPDADKAGEHAFGAATAVAGSGTAPAIGGKPKYLGIILTAILLLFLAAVAAWASLFSADGLSKFFGRDHDDTDVAILQDDTAPASPAPLNAPDPDVTASLSQPDEEPDVTPRNIVEVSATEPEDEALTDADIAVLDAMRQPAPPEPLTPARAEARYAVSGIWQLSPVAPDPSNLIDIDDIYLASIDPVSSTTDAVALPSATAFLTDELPEQISSPTAAGTVFNLDDKGLVIPTAEGAVTPDGVLVYLGKPPVVPPEVPQRGPAQTDVETATQSRLSELRPRLRPDDLIEQTERTQLGGLTRSELAGIRPKLRPDVAKVEEERDETPTDQAIATSIKPNMRPKNMDQIVQQANVRAPEPVKVAAAASVAPVAVAPSIPSTASVAKQATVKNAIKLNQINLIGVYGKPSSRRALVRLENGRYKKVQVGDRIDGGKISAIGDSELRYTKGGRNVVLKMPKS